MLVRSLRKHALHHIYGAAPIYGRRAITPISALSRYRFCQMQQELKREDDEDVAGDDEEAYNDVDLISAVYVELFL